ncbi:hypothetical protein Mal4_04110 [Maioricimonas rarisocia]|uniref:Uncharacterized protein n=1 Tax=Maioricimonas rarisocia TaxID=2528026 RepID=A0A517Z0X2_9PLAN|nr:hypothetical protein [Maioricimonas rarisocia]QDU36128.1 hypothetical protein Mal4_04110 [Maioricimonas rarisocia]
MNDQPVREERAYRHVTCGNETLVGGQSFEVVSNPMSGMERTMCSSCNAMFPISEFEWSDTGESLPDYYARHSQNATDMQKLLCSKKFMVAVILFFVVLTEIGIYFLLADEEFAVLAFCLVGGLMIGGIIGMSVFISGFADPIKKKVCGVSDTRLLT